MTDTPKTGSYHHGQLRRALIDAALHLVVERGINGFTLREVARQAGVSHAAPYHHFEDKSALIEALATECYDRFSAALRNAAESMEGSAIDKFLAIGLRYIEFAIQQNAEFVVMTRSELRHHPSSDGSSPRTPLDAASGAAYQVLIDGVAACQREGFIQEGDPTPFALTAWATMHGLAMLLLDGAVGRSFAHPLQKIDSAQIARMVTERLAFGLLAR